MKKVILSTTSLLLLAAATHAQIIDQAGAQQYANQVMNGNGQSSTIRQVQAQDNPDRTNFGNYAITFQGFPNNTSPNTALIEQNGGSQGNRAGLTQGGGNNLATIQQNGGPDGLSGGGISSSATIGAPAGDGNFAGILQQGNNSTALLAQNNNSRQNGAEIYQNGLSGVGTRNKAVVIQANNSVNNDGFIYQGYSSQNVAAGAVTNNEAYIYQGRTYYYDEPYTVSSVNNLATITQLANNNIANVYQGGTVNGLAGDSFGNVASVLQQGDGTIANVYQGTGGAKATDSRASIAQTGLWSTDNIFQGYGATGLSRANTASITSVGTTNYRGSGNIYQGYEGVAEMSQATIQQTQLTNTYIRQGYGKGASTVNAKAIYTQNGLASYGGISQNDTKMASGFGLNSTSVGKNNTAIILQGTGGWSSSAYISQGTTNATENLRIDGNTATINQLNVRHAHAQIAQGGVGTRTEDTSAPYGGTGPTFGYEYNTDAINNTTSIIQAGGSTYYANIYQGGIANSVQVVQSGGNNFRAEVVQAKNARNNQAVINQTSTGERNTAVIYQYANVDANGVGASNTAIINQIAGSDNIAIAQQGKFAYSSPSSNNYLRITQNGNDNQARLAQLGNNNYADITQNGNGNRLVNATGTAGSYALQVGNNNRLILTQNPGSGPGLSFTYTQIGNNNTQIVTQTNAN